MDNLRLSVVLLTLVLILFNTGCDEKGDRDKFPEPRREGRVEMLR